MLQASCRRVWLAGALWRTRLLDASGMHAAGEHGAALLGLPGAPACLPAEWRFGDCRNPPPAARHRLQGVIACLLSGAVAHDSLPTRPARPTHSRS